MSLSARAYDLVTMRNVALLIAYDGTDFHGWQAQPGQRTVQETLEQAIRRVVRHQARLVGSGRTDSGVHAAGQVANFFTASALPVSKLRHAIGSRLPKDLSVVALWEVHPDFDARQNAISKLYRYRVFHARHRPVDHLRQRYVYHVWHDLNVQAMQEAAWFLVGRKDFAALAAKSGEKATTIRTVDRCDVERHLDEIRFDVEGRGFLYNQVRNMVGTLLQVGLSRWRPEYIESVLESRDRSRAGPTAPARGLCLQWVRYPEHLLRPDAAPPCDAADAAHRIPPPGCPATS